MEVSELLVPDPVAAINVTPAYLFRKCGGENGPPTILFDEIDTVFGPKAKENEEIRALLNSGHRRGATAGRCVVRGKNIETEEISSYAAVALAGLGWLPDTILTRSIIIRMRRRAPDEKIEPFRRRVHAPIGEALRRRLAGWAAAIGDEATEARPSMPAGIEDRRCGRMGAIVCACRYRRGWVAKARPRSCGGTRQGRPRRRTKPWRPLAHGSSHGVRHHRGIGDQGCPEGARRA